NDSRQRAGLVGGDPEQWRRRFGEPLANRILFGIRQQQYRHSGCAQKTHRDHGLSYCSVRGEHRRAVGHPLNFMTREHLLNGGRRFVDQFTQIIVDQIRKTPGPVPFAVSNFGSVSLSTPGTSTDSTAGYAQIQADAGRTTASGLAIIGLRQRNVLVTEAGIPATPPIQSGRIYVEMSGSVNTGIAIANPNNQPAAIQFYFTGPQGDIGAGTTTIAANGQIAKFLDEVPFSAAKPLTGTFTFISS